jgi:hypothetical protein
MTKRSTSLSAMSCSEIRRGNNHRQGNCCCNAAIRRRKGHRKPNMFPANAIC